MECRCSGSRGCSFHRRHPSSSAAPDTARSRSAGRKCNLEVPCITFPVEFLNAADSIDMSLHDVPAKTGVTAHRPLKVDDRSFGERSQAAAVERFARLEADKVPQVAKCRVLGVVEVTAREEANSLLAQLR